MQTKKYTVITGASSGIGYETAKVFAERDKNVIIVARRQEQLHKLKHEILTNSNVDIVIKTADLTKVEDVYQLYIDLKQYQIETWINNAGFGFDGLFVDQEPSKITEMIQLNVQALTLLSSFFVNDYRDIEGSQLINVASVVGYTLIPETVVYSATKFFVTAFTEGLDKELRLGNHKMRAKILAPAATQTGFASVASNEKNFNYQENFEHYHTAQQMAEYMLNLYDSDKTVGIVDMNSYKFELKDAIHPSL